MTSQDRSGMERVRENGHFTDFSILCEGERIDVHRVILSGYSPVFYRACTSRFREATTRIYKIDDFPLSIVRRMVEYMYTGDYSSPRDSSTSEDDDEEFPVLLVHTTVAMLADKYDVQGLISLAARKYGQALEEDGDFEKFLESVPDIYGMPTEPSKALRDVAVEFARREVWAVMTSRDVWDRLDETLERFPRFSKDLLGLMLHGPPPMTGRQLDGMWSDDPHN